MPDKAVAKISGSKSGNSKPQMSHRILTKKHVHAATLQAQGKTAKEICISVGITPKQLETMRLRKIYHDEVERQVTIFRNRVTGSILGQKDKRNALRETLAKRLMYVASKRAKLADEDPELEAQGGKAGLVIRKPVGRGNKVVYEVDDTMVGRFQSLMNDVAKENGEMGAGRDANQGVVVIVNLNKEEQSWL